MVVYAHNGILFSNEKEQSTVYTTAWKTLTNLILGEEHKTLKGIYYVTPLTQSSKTGKPK